VRGDIPAPAPGTQWDSLIVAPVGEHSAKPEIFLEMVESYYPNLPKIELNRRGAPRPNWYSWGYETDSNTAEDEA
jgi:N6-adenosine-specific RNA methylase IME4